MTLFLYRLLLVLAVCMPASLHAQMQQGGIPDAKKFVIFLHTGPRDADDPTIKQIAVALLQKGYLVRAPDNQRDQVGGPGVDYFDASALVAAQEVAKTLNELFPKLGIRVDEKKQLKPRLQQTKSPPGYLGVWLF